MQVLLECCYILMEISQWEKFNYLFCRKVSFLTALHCQFRGVGQGMKQIYICICGILYIKLNTRNRSFTVTREIIHTIYKDFISSGVRMLPYSKSPIKVNLSNIIIQHWQFEQKYIQKKNDELLVILIYYL
jgi:hypothetical protein